MTFESLQLSPFWLEELCVKIYILMFLQHFQCEFGLDKVNYARITITPACFIAMTYAWSLWRCLNTWSINLVLPQLPGDSTYVNA